MSTKKVSLPTAVLMIMNIMVGSGILIGPGSMAAISGNASFLGWLLAALFFLPIVLSVVELNRLFPGCGGFYTYTKQGLGHTAGILSGIIYVIGYTMAAAVEIVVLRSVMMKTGLNYWFVADPIVFNTLATGICVALNLLAINIFGRIINSMTIAKLLPLLILIGLIPFVFHLPFTISSSELMMVPMSVFPMAIFGYFGFEYCCGMAHLIKNSEKNAPRAILIGFLGTGLLYSLFHFGLLNLMGAENLARFGAPAFAQFITLPVPYICELLGFLIPVASIITFFAAANGMMNVNALMMQAMAAESGNRAVSWLVPLSSWGRPWIAILTQGIIIFSLATLVPNVEVMAGLTNMGILSSFLLPLISLMIIQVRSKASIKALLLTSLGIVMTLGLTLYSAYGLW